MKRYPPTADPTLKVFSAADDLLLNWSRNHLPVDAPVQVFHDRFGALALSLPQPVRFRATYHSQEEALRRNACGRVPVIDSLFDKPTPTGGALLRVPKSLDLFESYLALVAAASGPSTRAAAGFMTRHYTPRLLEIAGRFAGRVEQSRAHRKARLLLLSEFKAGVGGGALPIRRISYAGKVYRQYAGVFSVGHIDYATQFLLQHWDEFNLPMPSTILDVACGNGIIGDQLLQRYAGAALLATDDSRLAVESACLNLPPLRARVLYAHTLEEVPAASQDLVVTNPPFHFGYENNIEISLGLFHQAKRVLKPGGRLVVVANRHLNYGSHLARLYAVEVLAQNDKFEVYGCR